MHRLVETLIYRALEPGTALSPGNTGAMGVELLGGNFSDHLYSAALELSTEPTGGLRQPLAGMPLPFAGKNLPLRLEEEPQPPNFVDTASRAEPVGHLPLDRFFDSTLPSAEIGDTDREAESLAALPFVTKPPRDKSDIAEPVAIARRPVHELAGAAMFTPKPEPAVAPLSSRMWEYNRIPAEVSERTQVLPPAALRQSSVPTPPPAVVPEVPAPVAETSDKLPQQPILSKDTTVPFIPRHENNRHIDHRSENRRQDPKRVIAEIHGNRADTAIRVTRELTSLNMPAATQGTMPSLSVAPLPAHMTSAALAPGSTGLAPLPPATTLVTAVDTPVLDPAWPKALQDRILWLAGKNIQSAEIRLNPADLGPLKVQISVDDNSTNISFSATHAVTRDALEIALPRLKDMLAENGMLLTNASVSDEGKANQRNEGHRSNPAEIASDDEDTTQAASELLTNRVTTRDPSSLVDTYA